MTCQGDTPDWTLCKNQATMRAIMDTGDVAFFCTPCCELGKELGTVNQSLRLEIDISSLHLVWPRTS